MVSEKSPSCYCFISNSRELLCKIFARETLTYFKLRDRFINRVVFFLKQGLMMLDIGGFETLTEYLLATSTYDNTFQKLFEKDLQNQLR